MSPQLRPRFVALAAISAVWACVPSAAGQAFQSDIDRWVTQDMIDPPEAGSILFIGSSSIRRWELLTRDFADYKVIQRGFGGAQFEDVNFFVDDIVLPYAPTAIVVWAGTNDNTSGETGAEVFADYQQFVGLVHAAMPTTEIFYLGITPTPTNGIFTVEREAANALIRNAALLDARLHYIDLPSVFDALGPPSSPEFVDLYVDGVHLNRAGYAVWTNEVRPVLEASIAPNKVFVPNRLTPQPGTSVFFDFGPSNPDDGNPTIGVDAFGNTWNNWHPAEGGVAVNAGEHLGNLVDQNNTPTGIDLTITGGFSTNGIQNGGLLAPAPAQLGELAVPTATQDYFFSTADDLVGGGNDDVPGGFMLSGLDPALVYDFRFFGSRTSGGTTRVTRYEVTGANGGLTTLATTGTNIGADGVYDGNDNEIAEIAGIRPDAFGQVFVDLTLVQGGFAYINAMELRVVPLSIDIQPADTVVDAGGVLTFTASVQGAAGTATLAWERDGIALIDNDRVGGASTESLTISGAGRGDAGLYRLVATLNTTSVASSAAVGAVRESPLGDLDFNNDGMIDTLDVFDFVVELETTD